MILAARKVNSRLEDEADANMDSAIASLSRHVDPHKSVVMATIMAASKRMGAALGLTLVNAASDMRKVAATRLHAELAAAGYQVNRGEMVQLQSLVYPDTTLATSAGESLAVQWRSSALSRSLTAIRKEASVPKALEESRRVLRSSIERTAHTEAVRAYSEAHRQEMAELLERDVRARQFVEEQGLQREWVCMVDACDDCLELDGERCDIDGSFPGGAIAPLHPRCRCQEMIVSISHTRIKVA